jgi:hypothetical protein
MAERSGDGASLVRAALGAGGIWVQEERDVVGRARLHAVWERASSVVPPDSLEEARLAARLAAEAVYEGGSLEPVQRAVEAVRAFGHDSASAEALSLLHHVQLGPRYAERRLGLAEEMVRLGARAGDTMASLMGLCWRTVDLFLLGNLRANQSLQELRERAEAADCEAIGFIADVLGAMLLARSGRLGEAEVAADAALKRGASAGDPDAIAYYGATLAALRWWQGRANEVIELVRTISTSPRLGFNDHVYVAADALMSATSGDTDEAEEALARLTSIGLGRLPESSSWLTTQALVAEAAYVLGDAGVATDVGQHLAPFAHRPVMPSLAVVCLGSAERGLGLCAATTGRLDAAVQHLDSAIDADRLFGSRPMAAVTEHTLAGVLSVRGANGDHARADQLAERAEERAGRMGMVLPSHPFWLTAGHGRSRQPSQVREATLEPYPGGWRIAVGDRRTVLPGRVGFSYLVQLVERPGKDLDVVALASGVGNGARPATDTVLDEQAVRSYRRRASELTSILTRGDLEPGAARRYRGELAELTAAVQSATGLGGRRRAFPDDHERARTAVRKALVRAVMAITVVEPALGHHLHASISTGATCSYTPGAGWRITAHWPAQQPPA